jgi:hypothetical protein
MMTVIQMPQPAPAGKTIRGRGLALRKLGKAQRALLAADIARGEVMLTDLSIRQIAAAVGVSVAYAHAALRLSALEREGVRRGLRPLVQQHAPAGPRERLAKLVDEIGIDAALDLLAQTQAAAA